jgi:predicted Ser/Thr protein kinase
VELRSILDQIDAVSISKEATLTQLKHEEDNEPYQVWKMDTHGAAYILKEAKGNEKEVYSSVLTASCSCAPALRQIVETEEKTYLLMDYIEGEDLCKCDRRKLQLALDALISLQEKTWEMEATGQWEGSFHNGFLQRQNRGKYLHDPLLEQAYEKFLDVFLSVPRTLCHDDLLPFNIICGKEKAVMIDWEYAGILPYPTSFARLIAHTEENRNALFYMTEADKRYAIAYYYDRLLKGKGISYPHWCNTLEYFLFYEYCEWVFVGHRYQATDGLYYKKYLPLAKQQAARIMQMEDP